ncbi:MAG TPA: aldehyde reductase [Hyphomicrobiaceae bacterium]|nr:aldehyde reductase [Hyphomicrobiaceae bacterium]
MSMVLVTGGSGFIAGHIVLQLLAAGQRVRVTVRRLAREADVRAALKAGGVDAGERLSLAEADLRSDAGWDAAVAGCEYVMHVASPFPAGVPDDEEELIETAREGTLRVLRAARTAGVRRVVLTSSFAAIGYGHSVRNAPFDETSWTNPSGPDVQPYIRSKTLAERAAWQFVASEGSALELAVINPVAVFGPLLNADLSTSVVLIRRLMDGTIPALARVYFGVVDVRDVADLHIRAMTHPAAAGERFLAVAGDFMSLAEVAGLLRSRLGAAATKVARWELPDWLVRLAATRIPAARLALPQLGRRRNATSAKARRVLGWAPRPREEAIIATAESLIRLGLA